MAERAGGMFDRAHVAAMLGVTPAAIEKQRQRRQILGVPYGSENRYPAAQFAGGEALPHLKQVLESFGDTNPWEQLMLLTTPLAGYGEERETPFEILMRRPGTKTVDRQGVVWGQSESGRVDIGGRRCIKKKNQFIYLN